MRALFFGGIGTLADTSFLQLRAFNQAFAEFRIPWHWDESTYASMLCRPDGTDRIERFNRYYGGLPLSVSVIDVHKRKTAVFLQLLKENPPNLRPGVADTLSLAQDNKIPVVFASTTYQETVDALLTQLNVDPKRFALITHRYTVPDPKPSPDIYQYCLSVLQITPDYACAIEDSTSGVNAASSSKIACVGFPNSFTARNDFTAAHEVVKDLAHSQALNTFLDRQRARITA